MRVLLSIIVSLIAILAARPSFADDGPVLTDDFWKPMTLKMETDVFGTHIYLVGEIQYGNHEAFEAFIKKNNPPVGTTVWLYSPGGNPYDGMDMGRVIREHGLKTSVGRLAGHAEKLNVPIIAPGECDSACTVVFMGGTERDVPDGSHFGVHNANIGDSAEIGNFEQGQIYSGLLTNYYGDMGIVIDLFEFQSTFFSRTGELHYMTADELQSYRVTTAVYDTRWSVAPNASGMLEVMGKVDGPLGPSDVHSKFELNCMWPRSSSVSLSFVDQNVGRIGPEKQFAPGDMIQSITISDPGGAAKDLTLADQAAITYIDGGRYIRVLLLDNDDVLNFFTKAAFAKMTLVRKRDPDFPLTFTLSMGNKGRQLAAFEKICRFN